MYLSNLLCKVECLTEHRDCVFQNTRSCAVRSVLVQGMLNRRRIFKWRYRKIHGVNQSSHLKHYFGLLKVYLITGFKCWYCGKDMQIIFGSKPGSIQDMYTFDHRVALSEGGENLIDNMVICCYRCNQERSKGRGKKDSTSDTTNGVSE